MRPVELHKLPARHLVMLFVAVVLAMCGALSVSPAQAHSELESSTPAEGATVSTLTEITLTFGEAIVPEMSKYSLTDEMGMTVKLGEPSYDSTKTIVTVPLRALMMNGKQVIGYSVLSIDGHPIAGKINFTYGAPGKAGGPDGRDHSGTPGPGRDHQDMDGDHAGGSNTWANLGYAAGGLVGGALIVVVITLVVRRRSKAKQARLDDNNPSE